MYAVLFPRGKRAWLSKRAMNLKTSTHRLALAARKSDVGAVQASARTFLFLMRCVERQQKRDILQFVRVLLAVRRDAVVYEWVHKRPSWRFIVERMVAIMRSLIASNAQSPRAQRLFARVVTVLLV